MILINLSSKMTIFTNIKTNFGQLIVQIKSFPYNASTFCNLLTI